MSDCCNTNPTSGCTDNQQAVQIKIMDAKIIPLFVNLEASIEALGQAFLDCCEETGNNIDEINTLLTTIIENNSNCCDQILAKLACIEYPYGNRSRRGSLCFYDDNNRPYRVLL